MLKCKIQFDPVPEDLESSSKLSYSVETYIL